MSVLLTRWVVRSAVVLPLLGLACASTLGGDGGTGTAGGDGGPRDGGANPCPWPGSISPWNGQPAVSASGVVMEVAKTSTRVFTCFGKPPLVRTESVELGADGAAAISRGGPGSGWLLAWQGGVVNVAEVVTQGVVIEGDEGLRRRPTAAEARSVLGPKDPQGRSWLLDTDANGVQAIVLVDGQSVELARGPAPAQTVRLASDGAGIVALQRAAPSFDLVTYTLTADLPSKTISATELARRATTGGLELVGLASDGTSTYQRPTKGIVITRSKATGNDVTTFIDVLSPSTLQPVWTSAAITSRTVTAGSASGVDGEVFDETSTHLVVHLRPQLRCGNGSQVVNGVGATTHPSGLTGVGPCSNVDFLLMLSLSTHAVDLVVADLDRGPMSATAAMDPAGGFYAVLRTPGVPPPTLVHYGPDLKKDLGPPVDVSAPGFDCDAQSFAALPDIQASSQCMSACVYCAEKYQPSPPPPAGTGLPRTAAEIAQLQSAVDGSCGILSGLGTGFVEKCAFCTNPQCK